MMILQHHQCRAVPAHSMCCKQTAHHHKQLQGLKGEQESLIAPTHPPKNFNTLLFPPSCCLPPLPLSPPPSTLPPPPPSLLPGAATPRHQSMLPAAHPGCVHGWPRGSTRQWCSRSTQQSHPGGCPPYLNGEGGGATRVCVCVCVGGGVVVVRGHTHMLTRGMEVIAHCTHSSYP